MAELGATADAPTPYLRDLNASAGQLTRFLDNLGPFAEAAPPETSRTLAKTADKARPAIALRQADRRRAHQDDRAARPSSPTTSRSCSSDLDDRSRAVEKDKRSPGRQGLHGLRGGPPIHLRPDAGHQHLRRERPHPQGQPLASECSDTRTPTPSSARRSRSPASSAAASPASARTSRASPPPTRPTPASTIPARRARPLGQEDEEQVHAGQGRGKSKNAPGQPDLKKALEKLLKGGGGGNKPSVPSLPNVKVPNVPLPSVPPSPRRPERRRRAAVHGRRIPGPPRLPPGPMRGRGRILRVRQPRARRAR